MTLTKILFFLFGGIAIVSALIAVTRRNPVVSALWLVVMFFGLAGTYVVLEAFFVGAVQVLVYAGAIMVLFLFVIMLLDLRDETLDGKKPPILRFFGGMAGVLFVVVAVFAVNDARAAGLFDQTRTVVVEQVKLTADGKYEADAEGNRLPPGADKVMETVSKEVRVVDMELDGGAREIGLAIFTRWLLAFEVTSILLLGAIFGAVILTKRRLT